LKGAGLEIGLRKATRARRCWTKLHKIKRAGKGTEKNYRRTKGSWKVYKE
jgi:hypothetical protein